MSSRISTSRPWCLEPHPARGLPQFPPSRSRQPLRPDALLSTSLPIFEMPIRGARICLPPGRSRLGAPLSNFMISSTSSRSTSQPTLNSSRLGWRNRLPNSIWQRFGISSIGWVVGQVIQVNPAAPVRGPKYTVKKGQTPVLTQDEARHLLDSIDDSTLKGLRARALIATMIYTFGRVGAVLKMRVEDYYTQGRQRWVRLHERR